MGAEASKRSGERAQFSYKNNATLFLWSSQRVDALFAEDGQFYEAEIQGFEGGQIRVLFVEYGNEQLCELEELRPICDYQIGDEVEAKFAVDDQWYSAMVMDYDPEFKEYTVQFIDFKEEQICDRSFLRPLPDVVDNLVQAELKRQKSAEESDPRNRSKTSVQKRLEAKQAELEKKQKLKADEDEFGEMASSKSPRKAELTIEDALASSGDEEKDAAKNRPPPPKVNPFAAAADAAKKAVVNPIAAAAAALVAKKTAAKAVSEKQAPSKRDSTKVRDLFASDNDDDDGKVMEAGDDPFVTASDDPFADAPLFSDIDDKDEEDDGPDSQEESDAAIAAKFLAEKEAKKKAEAAAAAAAAASSAKEQEEQRLLREQMFSKIEDDIDWLSGEECEALWAQDGNWYKALVIAAEVDGTYTVEFTEYGDIQEATHPTEMRKIVAASTKKKDVGVVEESTPSDEDASSSPSPLPVRVSSVTPPKVSVPALKLASPAADAAPAGPKLVVSKIEKSSSDDDDDEYEKAAKLAAKAPQAPKVSVPIPEKKSAPSAALPPPPKKALPPSSLPKRNTQAEEEEKRRKSEEERKRKLEEEEEKRRLEEEEEKRKIQEQRRMEEEAEREAAERLRVEEEERQQLEENEAQQTVELDPEFAEMAALLQPEEHHIPDGPPLTELEGLFEDDEFMDFLPDHQDGQMGPDGEMGDEGDASQIFGIFDGDFGFGNDGPAGAKDAFLRFSMNRDGLDAAEVVQDFVALREAAELEPMGSEIDPRLVRKGLRAAIEKQMDFKSPKLGIFRLLDKQSKRPDVLACGDTLASRLRVLVVGAGIGGLRVACELALLGVRVVVVEKRTTFSRNNVLHLWSHVVADVQALGAAFWVPGFCKGNIHHCAIRKLQLCLLRSALLLGVDVFLGCSFEGRLEGVERKRGQWRAKCDNVVIADYNFNVLIGADGEASKVAKYVGFDKKETAYSLALGITANFENSKTKSQLGTAEVNVARHFKQEWFAKLAREKGIELENMVYYKDDTHYFVCTAMKESLLTKGVLKADIPDLVSPANVNKQVLQTWCEEVASYAGLPKSASLVPIVRADGSVQPDTAIFDFSRKFRAVVPVRVFASSRDMTNDDLLWTFVIGDALMEPFWPLGTGANRAVLSAWDTMATLVQVGMLGLTTAESVFQDQKQIGPLVEAAMAMYAALQASDPNTMKPEKFKMPGEPSPLYSFDPNSRYPRMKASSIPEGEGQVIDWDQFVPDSSHVINTLSKADSDNSKKRLSSPFIPKAITGSPAAKGPAKRVTSLAPVPKKAPAPAPVAIKLKDAPPASIAPTALPAKQQAAQPPPPAAVEEDLTRLSMAVPAEAAPVPVKTGSRITSIPPPARKAAAPPAAASPAPVKKPGTTNRGSELVKNPRATIQQVAANDPTVEVVDFSANTMFAMKHRELCKELAAALPSNTVIKEVHLKSCELDKTDVQELCAGIVGHKSLAVLDLEKNKIDNDGAELLARALCQNTSIRELNLLGQARAFGDACLTSFVDMFDFNVTITKIIWRLDSRKSFAINKLLVRNNTIQKNLSENRDVSAMLPAKCNLPSLKAGGSQDVAAVQEDDDDYCATVDLNVAIKPTPAKAPSKHDSAKLDAFEDDMYDEAVVKDAHAAAPVKAAPLKRGSDSGGDDDYLDTIDLNAVVPAKAVAAAAPKAPAPSSPRSVKGILPPSVTGGGRLRAMSGRGKAPPNTAALLANKLPPRKLSAAAPLPARKSSTPPARDLVEAARSAVAEVVGAPVPIQAAPSSLPPAPVPPKKSNSVPAPANAPPEVVAVYEALSVLNDRYLIVSSEGSEDLVAEQKDMLSELARVRDIMQPLHTKYKIQGYVVKAVASWRTLNTSIPKLSK